MAPADPEPTWEDTIAALFAAPPWIEPANQRAVAAEWLGCMGPYGVQLDDFTSVSSQAVTIYQHLASRSMPLTNDPTQYWPPDALALLATWIQQGCRRTEADPIVPTQLPGPPPAPPPLGPRTRRDILSLAQDELDAYRAALEDIGASSINPKVPWQQIAYVHTDWCLHYQEAFLLWHRANLLYFEQALGMAVPYWDFMSVDASVDGTPQAGLPQPFRDLTYIHPETGEERANPLRFAVAKDGCSKACAGNCQESPDCAYIQRDPVLYTFGLDQQQQREQKLAEIVTYQEQVNFALTWPVFSVPEDSPGYPWANILSFNPPPPDSDYPNRTDFDGLYEQPHDNFHGWIGPDMADNAYTAFDPVFWSYHANIDRVFEQWRQANPGASYTAKFPLRPFLGPFAGQLDFADARASDYTTIGDMAVDSTALGYDYGPPLTPPMPPPAHLVAPAAGARHLYVLYPDVRCLHDSYTIDVFLNLRNPTPGDLQNANAAHYVGRTTRLGMGVEDDRGRCVKTGVTRVLDATRAAERLGLPPESPVAVGQIVTDVTTGTVLGPDDYSALAGFQPHAAWGDPLRPASQTSDS